MPHSCIYLYVVSIFFNGWGMHFPLRDFHNIFSMPRIAEFLWWQTACPMPWLLLDQARLRVLAHHQRTVSLLSSFFYWLVSICGKKNEYITFSLCFIDYLTSCSSCPVGNQSHKETSVLLNWWFLYRKYHFLKSSSLHPQAYYCLLWIAVWTGFQ